jgi:hypothetical protein
MPIDYTKVETLDELKEIVGEDYLKDQTEQFSGQINDDLLKIDEIEEWKSKKENIFSKIAELKLYCREYTIDFRELFVKVIKDSRLLKDEIIAKIESGYDK